MYLFCFLSFKLPFTVGIVVHMRHLQVRMSSGHLGHVLLLIDFYQPINEYQAVENKNQYIQLSLKWSFSPKKFLLHKF